MMRTMRAIAPWIMVIVAVTFVGWMVFQVGMDVSGRGSGAVDEVASVNGEKIDQQTFNLAVRNTQDQRREQGLPPTSSLQEQQQLEDAVLERLVQDILIRQELARRGISVSDAEIRNALLNAPPRDIVSNPAFQTDSQFDLQKYQAFLRSGIDPTFLLQLESLYRDQIPRNKLLERVTSDVYVSNPQLWQMYRDQNDSVTANVIALVPAALFARDTVVVSDEAARRYLRNHQDEFRRPRRAFTSFVEVSREPNASDSAMALERARSLRSEIVGGADFAEVAGRESADSATRGNGGDLGEVAPGRFYPEFDSAARALRPGGLSQPVLTPVGYHLIQLESRSDSGYHARHILIPIEPYGDHLDQVDRRADSLDLYAAEQDDPASLDTVAVDLGLPVITAPPLEEGGQLNLGGVSIPDVPIWAFESVVGATSPVIETSWAYYVFRLDSVAPAEVPPFEEIQSDVRRAARRDEQWNRARAIADSIAAAFRAGDDIEAVAQRRGLHVQSVGPLTRVNPGPILRDVPDAVGALFGLALGAEGGPFESDYGIYFVEPVRRAFADSAAFAARVDTMRTQVIQQASQARVQLIEDALRKEANVVDRREALAELQRKLEAQSVAQPANGRRR